MRSRPAPGTHDVGCNLARPRHLLSVRESETPPDVRTRSLCRRISRRKSRTVPGDVIRCFNRGLLVRGPGCGRHGISGGCVDLIGRTACPSRCIGGKRGNHSRREAPTDSCCVRGLSTLEWRPIDFESRLAGSLGVDRAHTMRGGSCTHDAGW